MLTVLPLSACLNSLAREMLVRMQGIACMQYTVARDRSILTSNYPLSFPSATCAHQKDLPFYFFQYTFCAASVTIVAGTLAERCQMAAYLCYSFFLTGFVYPVVAHAAWSSYGFLSPGNADPLFGIGMVDFSGSGVIHLTGGTTALFAAYILGSRRGRFYDATTGQPLEVPKPFPGHSVSLQMLGTFILW